MSKLLTWSTTELNNSSASPDGFPELMAPSGLNNSSREVMAAAAYFADILGIPFINLGFTASVGSNNLTIALKTAAAADPASTDPVTIYFRNTTVTTGQRVAVDYSAATSVVLPGGGSLAFANSDTGNIFIYAVYDGTNKDIGVSRRASFDESALHSTTTIGTGSDADDIIYTTTGRTNAAVTLIGRITIQYGTAAWTNAPSNLTVWQPGMFHAVYQKYVPTVDGGGTLAATNLHFITNNGWLTCGGNVTLGTAAATSAAITLPTGFPINTSIVGANQVLGSVTRVDSAAGPTNVELYVLFYDGSDATKLFITNQSSSSAFVKRNTSALYATSNILSFEFSYPYA